MPTLSERLATIEEQNRSLREQNRYIMLELDRATRSRARLHERFDDVQNTVSSLATEMSHIAPIVDKLDDEFDRREGRNRLLTKQRVLAGTMIGSVGAVGALWRYWDQAPQWLKRIFGG